MLQCEAKTRKYVSLLTVKNQAIDPNSNYWRIQITSTYTEEEKFGAVWKGKSCLAELSCKNSKSKYDFTLYYTLASVEIFGYR